MARLDFSASKVLEVTTPSGEDIKFTPRRLTLSTSKEVRKKINKLQKELEDEKIEAEDYIIEVLRLRLEPFDEDKVINEFDLSELTEILYEIRDMQENPKRTDAEKKTI